MNKKIYLLVIPPLLLLFALGALNIYRKATWKEPTDGVIWEKTPEGLTAVKVEEGSPAYLHGIKKGDILYSINDTPIKNKIDLSKKLWEADGLNQKVTYEIAREGNLEGNLAHPSFYLRKKGTNLIYFFLSLVGITTLAIGLIVFFSSDKPFFLPYGFFFLLCVTFFAFYTFSPTGQLDVWDSLFFWLDKIAFLFFPPLMLHFFNTFPKRKKILKSILRSSILLYIPAFLLLSFKGVLHTVSLNEFTVLNLHKTSETLDLVHFGLYSLFTVGLLVMGIFKSPNPIIKKQLKGIVYGLCFAILPFTLIYILPFLLGTVPSKGAEFTVILQALIPLTFAYSISRYKFFDLEIILKKAVTLISSYVVIAIVYFIVSSQTKIFSENRLNALILGILAIILGATLFSPLKNLFQSLLDRVIYKKSYHYRKTLLSISEQLNKERNLQKLSQSLLNLISNALSLQYIALLLPDENNKDSFYILKSMGNSSSPEKQITFDPQIYHHLKKENFISADSLSEKRTLKDKLKNLSSRGFHHLLALKVEDKMVGCLAMGKKTDNTYLNSEDWELLKTIASSVGLALENAYLYNQAQSRARELEMLKDYSENIIESLTVGVAVLDQSGKIMGWNRVMEETFSHKKEEVMDKKLLQVLGEENYAALFPPDTQKGFRLLSEVTLEMPSGEKKIFDIAKTPLLDNQMNPYGTVIVFEDITEKFSLQQQLLTSEKLASVGLLSAGVAHEINTPLTGISSYVQLLQKKLTNDSHSQILDKIENQTERVGKIVKNLLNFARNPSESSFYQVKLKENIEEILSLIDYKLKNMKINLELELPSIPSIWAQGERLQQVFINIILNAIDAMPNGGTLKIQLSNTDNQAIVTIKDTGTGIKEQHLPNIFDPFFTTKGIGKGTGLGLSISYAIIKEHEGHLSVESEEGKGSLFTIYIPMDLDKRKMTQSS